MYWYQQGWPSWVMCTSNIGTTSLKYVDLSFAYLFTGPLSDNRLAVALWNRCSKVETITASWAALGFESGIHVSVRDLWTVHFHSIYNIFLCTVDRLHPPMGFGRSVNPK